MLSYERRSADALKNSAVTGNMFETFIVFEILKSYSNEGKNYRFKIFYCRGKDRSHTGKNEIDLIIEENGVRNKMSGNPKASMAKINMRDFNFYKMNLLIKI